MKSDRKNEQRSRFQRIKFYGIYLSKFKAQDPFQKKNLSACFQFRDISKKLQKFSKLKRPMLSSVTLYIFILHQFSVLKL